MKKSKVGDKRVNKDDFEQFEECNTCRKGFWARSELELGNWQRDCNRCQKIAEITYQKVHAKEIEAEKIFFNSLSENAYNLTRTIDDTIRMEKKKGITEKEWTRDEFDAIRYLSVANGCGLPCEAPFKFMGVMHYKK